VSTPALTRFAPLLFVGLWSTGFIGAKLGLPHAEPLTFLFIRYLSVIGLMTMLALAMRAPWPRDARHWFHIGVAGLLVHALYLGGVFTAISKGLPAGVASLVVGMQPLLTAVGAGWLLGVGLVVSGKIGAGFGLDALWPAFAALLGITAGTLYQKRFCPAFDWRTGAIAQFVPTAIATMIVAALTESFRVDWNGEFIFALGWLVFVLSIGAISLLNWLIRHGSAVNLASLFYLVPPCTALIAWALFDETLSGVALAGMALAVWGVYLARK
jgi:drug/metabolite transporter (DMT)-like permease